jgi:hypothetical protein
MKRTISALIAATAAVTALAGCGGPGNIAAHGTLQVFASPLSGQSVTDSYPDITSGSQVTVKNPSGTVIGTGTLAFDAKGTHTAETLFASGLGGGTTPAQYAEWVEAFTFTVKVPAGLARYGIQVGSGRGTIWFSAAQMSKGPGLSLGSATG